MNKRLEVLDGLRGVAAICVVIFHFMEIIFTDFSKNIIAHGFLAVDFFFCLSGFVMAYAYDARLPHISLKKYFTQRFIRLHPLVVLGTIFGLIALGTSHHYSLAQWLGLALASALMIPMPVMEDRYFNLFGLNAPSWSLFWEYVANIVYALILVKLPKKALLGLAAIAGIALVCVAQTAGNLLGGWNGETFWHGGVRMTFSFLAGMCVYRFQWKIKNSLGFLGLSVLLILAFLFPYREAWNGITEPLLVMLYFPLIIMLGAGTQASKSTQAICEFSGNLSYPLYMTHYCAMWAFGAYYAQSAPSGINLWLLCLGVFSAQLILAYCSMRWVDMPMRQFLKNKI